jgi:competence ComEA-like helix-hairpin-helix protein
MPILSKLESRLGLTRGDVTVTLFIALATLGGFIYLTFFDSRSPQVEHQEMTLLAMRHDSIVAARRAARLQAVEKAVAPADSASADSIPQWKPLTGEDAAADEAIASVEKPSGRGGGKEKLSGPLNLNSAPKLELVKLPGVGEKTAEAIIERRAHVPFRRIEDIMEVKGIGQKKFEKMKPYITVR